MGIFRDLVSNVANARMMEEQQKLAYNTSLGTSLLNLARNPTAKPGDRQQAAALFTDLMSKHGGKEGKMLQPQIQSLLSGYIASTLGGSQQLQDQGDASGQPQEGPAAPSTLTGQGQPFPGIAPGVQGMPQQQREQIAGQLGQQAMPSTLAPGAASGATVTASGAPPAARQQRGGFRGVLGHLAGGAATVGKELMGVPPGQPETPYDPKAFQMTPEQERKYDYDQNISIGKAAGLRGDALIEYGLTGKPPSDFGKTSGPTDAEIKQAGEQFDKFLAPSMVASGMSPQEVQRNRVQYMGGIRLGAPPVQDLYTFTDAQGQPHTVARDRTGGGFRDINTNQIVEVPAGAQYFKVGQQRAPSANMQAQETTFGAYATEVLKTPGVKLTDPQRLDAIAWAKKRAASDPAWAAHFVPVTKTVANPEGDPYLDMMAQEFIVNDKVPPGGMSGKGFERQEQVVRRADEMLQMAGYSRGDLMTIRTGIQANAKEFDRVVQQGGQLAIFNGTIQSNLANLRVLNARYERTDYPFANRLWDAWKTGKGDDDVVNFAAQLHILAIEWAKAMSGLMSNANVQVTSAADAEAIMSRYLSDFQVDKLFDRVIVPDLQGRENSQNAEKQTLQNAIRNFATLTPQQEPTTGAATLPPPQNQPTPTPTPAPTPTPTPAPTPTPTPQRGRTGDRTVDYLKRHQPPRR